MIRNAKKEDSLDIGTVYYLSWKEAYNDIVPSAFLNALTPEKCAPRRINSNENFVSEKNGKIIGHTNFGPSRDISDKNFGELRSIYVLPQYWGSGAGRELFDAVSAEIKTKGYDGFFLWVLKGNNRAKRFYKKMNMKSANIERKITIGGKDLIEVKYEITFIS